jgi:hypothetical protein
MANEIRVRGNLTSGTLSVALTNVATTMSSAGLANLPAVTATGHAVITIENEIIYVTAHTAAATTATILRGQEGTTGAAHSLNTAWVHGPVASDYVGILGYALAVVNQTGIAGGPTDLTSLTTTVTVPYAGHRIKITGHTQLVTVTAAAGYTVDIQEGATVLGRVAITSGLVTAERWLGDGSVWIVPSAGAHTYKLTATRFAGTGTLNVEASSTQAAWISVEDFGPAA